MKNLHRGIFICAALALIITSQYVSQKRLPFRIGEILDEKNEIQEKYRSYAKDFESSNSILLILERTSTKSLSGLVLRKIFDKLHFHLEQNINIRSVVSIANAEHFKVNDEAIKLVPFMDERGEISDQAKHVLNSENWKNLLVSEDFNHYLITLNLNLRGGKDFTNKQFEQLQADILNLSEEIPEFKLHLLGSRSVEYYLLKDANNTQQRLTPLLLFLLGILALYLFKDVKILICFVLCLVLANSLISMCIYFKDFGIKPFSGFALFFNLIVATANLVHFFSVYQKTPGTAKKRLQVTKEKVFIPCLMTSLATVLSFTSLLVNSLEPIWYIGFFSTLGSIFCFLLTFYFLPYFIQLFNIQISVKDEMPSLNTDKIFKASIRRAPLTVGIYLVLCAFLVIQSMNLTFDDKFYDKFVDSHNQSIATKFLAKNFNYVDSIDIILKPKHSKSTQEYWHKLSKFESDILAIPTVSHIQSSATFYRYLKKVFDEAHPSDKNKRIESTFNLARDLGLMDKFISPMSGDYRINVFLAETSTKNLELVMKQVKDKFDLHDDFIFSFNGHSILRTYINNRLITEMALSVGGSLVIIFLLFAVGFRSIYWALLGMIPNILPIVFITGIMGLFDIVIDSNIVLLVCVTIGIAMDDTIHFLWALSRVTKRFSFVKLSTVVRTFKETSPALLGTTLVFALSFPCFFLADLKVYFQVGIYVILSLVLALVADLLVLPAIIIFVLQSKRFHASIKNRRLAVLPLRKPFI